MKKLLLLSAVLLGAVTASQAGVRINIGIPAPVVVAPAPVYAPPPPVYVAPPPPVYAPPPVVVVPPPVVVRPPVIGVPYHHHPPYWYPRDRYHHW